MNVRQVTSAACVGIMVAGGQVFAQDRDWTPMLDRGTKELSIAGRLEFPDFDDFQYDLDGSYGYFLADGWELGLQVGAADTGGTDRIDGGLFTEYNFNRQHRWVPYLGAAIGLGSVSIDGGDIEADTSLDDGDGWVFDMEAGVKWFVRPYMAVSTAINFQLATDDVFATEDSIEDNLTSIQIGMRFYFE